MKITVKQLRQIIREAVEEELAKKEAKEMDEADLEEGWGDDTDYTGDAPEGKFGQKDKEDYKPTPGSDDPYDKPY